MKLWQIARNPFSSRPWLTSGVLVGVCAVVALAAALVATHPGTTKAGASSASGNGHPTVSLVSSQPAPGATAVAPDTSLALSFSTALAAGGPTPTLDPPVAGTWIQTSPGILAFEAAASLPPGATEQIQVPGGSSGIMAADGAHLTQSAVVSFTVAPLSTLRLQQLLAELGYLPVAFTPADTTPLSATELATPQLGTFSWRWSTLPGNFMALWSPGEPNLVTQSAIMAFESQHNLATDGDAGPQVADSVLQAAAAGQTNSYGHYDFAEVYTSLPEHVDVWRDGSVAYSTLANSGIEAAPTELGTWPVYARYVSTTMSGTNPDGSHYSDPDIPWVSYFHGGDALHGFVRSSYGTPQSLGCVEMPPANAEVVYPYTPLGTLVTVQ
ncbi:MAG TPA: L,D-transpeptidase family protein [Acidimicrobiales bacterium]|nr:L,D-transpeptidase family protein [Acidimicrobiales bacterium]